MKSDLSIYSEAMEVLAPLFGGMTWASAPMRPKPKPRPRGRTFKSKSGKVITSFYMPKAYRKWQKEFLLHMGKLEIPSGRIGMAIILQCRVPKNCPKSVRPGVLLTFNGGAVVDADNGAGSVMDALLPDGDQRVSMLIVVKQWGDCDRVSVGVLPLGEIVWPKKRKKKGASECAATTS